MFILRFFKNLAKYLYQAKFEILVFIFVLTFDLVSKTLVAHKLQNGNNITIIPHFFYFTYSMNYLAAFGSAFGFEHLFGEKGVLVFFIVLTILVSLLLIMYLFHNRGGNLWLRFGLALILAGAIGNMIDRISLHYVRDFISFEIFSWNAPIFNIADSSLTIGVIVFVLALFCSDTKSNKNFNNESNNDINKNDVLSH